MDLRLHRQIHESLGMQPTDALRVSLPTVVFATGSPLSTNASRTTSWTCGPGY